MIRSDFICVFGIDIVLDGLLAGFREILRRDLDQVGDLCLDRISVPSSQET